MKALYTEKAINFFISKYDLFAPGGEYYLEHNEESLYSVVLCEKESLELKDPSKFIFDDKRFPRINELKNNPDELTSAVYSNIFEDIIELDDEKWHTIFDIIKVNKAKNIHATIIGKNIKTHNLFSRFSNS